MTTERTFCNIRIRIGDVVRFKSESHGILEKPVIKFIPGHTFIVGDNPTFCWELRHIDVIKVLTKDEFIKPAIKT